MKKQIIPILIGIAIGVILALKTCSSNQATKEAELYRALQVSKDSILYFKTKSGEQAAKIRSFEVTKAEHILALEVQDTLIRKLQERVANFKKPETVIVHETEIIYQDTGGVVLVTDTTTNQIIWPINALEKNKFFTGNVALWPDSSVWRVSLVNELTLGIEKKKIGFLGSKGKEYTVTAINTNPYVRTTGIRSVVVREKPKRHHLVITGGYGVSQGLSPFVGIGYGYSLLSF